MSRNHLVSSLIPIRKNCCLSTRRGRMGWGPGWPCCWWLWMKPDTPWLLLLFPLPRCSTLNP